LGFGSGFKETSSAGVGERNIFTPERSLRAEVVTYRSDLVFGSLHMQQLHGFDELLIDQGIIRNVKKAKPAAKNTTAMIEIVDMQHVLVFDFFDKLK
jgi:hypothetical protein